MTENNLAPPKPRNLAPVLSACVSPVNELVSALSAGGGKLNRILSESPVWFDPNPSVLKYAGRSLRVIKADGEVRDVLIRVAMSEAEDRSKKYSLQLAAKEPFGYLVLDALSMIQKNDGSGNGTDFVLRLNGN